VEHYAEYLKATAAMTGPTEPSRQFEKETAGASNGREEGDTENLTNAAVNDPPRGFADHVRS
jgi:hypothetical protein